MDKIKSLADLKKKREDLQAGLSLRERGDNMENLIQIKVAMATCGIASGAKQVMDFLIKERLAVFFCAVNSIHVEGRVFSVEITCKKSRLNSSLNIARRNIKRE